MKYSCLQSLPQKASSFRVVLRLQAVFYPTSPYLKLSLSVLPLISPASPFFQT